MNEVAEALFSFPTPSTSVREGPHDRRDGNTSRDVEALRLRVLLSSHGIGSRELASALGVHESVISLYLSGRRRPSTARLHEIYRVVAERASTPDAA
jgi:hypothetical protein